MIQIILVSSQMVLLHANDLLDQRIIQEGCFVPLYTSGSLLDSINEMIDLVNSTLASKAMEIVLIEKARYGVPKIAKFDKRRLQQVLLNLLSNSVKYSWAGTIEVKPEVVFEEGNYLL